MPEYVYNSDMITISDTDPEVFTKDTRPQKYFFSFEKSMYQTVSEEMLSFISSVVEFNNLIGPKPAFEDVDGDGIGERPLDIQQDEQLRISTADDKRNSFITRTNEQALDDSQNQGKTLESMRNKLNTYLGDVDNVIENFEDQRPEYENKSEGFLKIRQPNQAIIVRAPDDGLLEFQKNDSIIEMEKFKKEIIDAQEDWISIIKYALDKGFKIFIISVPPFCF